MKLMDNQPQRRKSATIGENVPMAGKPGATCENDQTDAKSADMGEIDKLLENQPKWVQIMRNEPKACTWSERWKMTWKGHFVPDVLEMSGSHLKGAKWGK